MVQFDAIINARIITPYRIIDNAGVVIKDGIIAEVLTDGNFDKTKNMRVFDAEGLFLSPGFIDIHTHGGGGHDYMEGSPDAMLRAARTHLAHGTTSMLPTTYASSDEELYRAIDCFLEVRYKEPVLPRLLGMHLEGPYLSHEQKGAQNPGFLKDPKREEYLKILEYAKGTILVWTVAPELPGGIEMGRELRKRGVIPSIGHSDAYYEDVVKAYENGYELVTHLYSGCSMLRRKNSYRYLGVVESAFLLDSMYVEVIADGHHLPVELLRLIYKIKGPDKIILVTDSIIAAGLPDGEYFLGSAGNRQKIIVENGVAVLPDRSSFAGSVATADHLIRTMHKRAGLPLQEAVMMMTVNPATLLGKVGTLGVISVGAFADLVVFDENINVRKVFVGGVEAT